MAKFLDKIVDIGKKFCYNIVVHRGRVHTTCISNIIESGLNIRVGYVTYLTFC